MTRSKPGYLSQVVFTAMTVIPRRATWVTCEQFMLGTGNSYGQSAMELSTELFLFKVKLYIFTPRTSAVFQVIISKLVQMSLTTSDTIKELKTNKQVNRNKDFFLSTPRRGSERKRWMSRHTMKKTTDFIWVVLEMSSLSQIRIQPFFFRHIFNRKTD